MSGNEATNEESKPAWEVDGNPPPEDSTAARDVEGNPPPEDSAQSPPADEAKNQVPADATADAIGEVSAVPETLHMAARAGSLSSVDMLLRNKADPNEKDKEGKTALEYAESAGKIEVAEALRKAMGIEGKPVQEAPPASTEPQQRVSIVEPSEEPADSTPAVQLDNPANATPGGGQDTQSKRTPPSPLKNDSKQKPGGGTSHKEIQERTAFSASTCEGVLKRTTFMHSLSTYPTSPKVAIGSRGSNMFQRSASGPAPGTYTLPDDGKSKFKNPPHFSFGGGTRFGLGQSPLKLQPGPGAYNPKDPSEGVDTKVGFGTSVRNKGLPPSQQNPGPGAYEQRTTLGHGLMFTACGRHVGAFMRSRSLPGPGAYTPTLQGAYQTSPKCGFGTSTRGDFTGGVGRGQPGPGTYEMQNQKCVGKGTPKYSATSRRRMHDLSSYVTPGPGTYNAHVTSFGHAGAASNRFVDEAYKSRANSNAMSMTH